MKDVSRIRFSWTGLMDLTCRHLLQLLFTSLLLLLSTYQSSATNASSTNSLDSTIRDCAFRELAGRRTGVLYRVPLPANLTGITASVIRLRSGRLRLDGISSTMFHIPPKTAPVPYVKRLVLVYQDLGNWSDYYYSVPGYSLASPVVGLLAYDASSLGSGAAAELNLTGGSISVAFPEVRLPGGADTTTSCARFGADGSVRRLDGSNKCRTAGTGHFGIVAPAAVVERGGGRWVVWVGAGGGGVVGLVLVGLVGVGIYRVARNKKMRGMERRAEEGAALGSVWVEGSKMPSATLLRTQPVIESGSVP